MAKAATKIDIVEDEGVGGISEDMPETVKTTNLDTLRVIAKAASDVVGYYGGATYETDKNEGVAVLSEFGIHFAE